MNARSWTHLLRHGVLEIGQHGAWTTTIVPVIKSVGSFRICNDYKCTVSKALRKDLNQIRAVNDILATLKKGKNIREIRSNASVPAARSRQSIGSRAVKAKRIQFSNASASGIFQRFMDSWLANLDDVVPGFDDTSVRSSAPRGNPPEP
ncbi:conserved hypothetical protein [Trichinella spiralis]|uniref:hypothetical protein n=1 Tax=Trichinella spiralis TaxID=6334 RepID=UPI0001EFB6CF|nr:conserved hypothetical protein [Trichinella spiralis]